MKLHPRFFIVKRADNELGMFVIDWAKRHDLTWTEIVRCLLNEASECTRYMLRSERHPDDQNKKADEK